MGYDGESFLLQLYESISFFAVLMASLPYTFNHIVDILVLIHANFSEWDVNLVPASISFLFPHAAIAFGKVAHIFMSRPALQRNDMQTVKVLYSVNQFFINDIEQEYLEHLDDPDDQD